MTTPDEQRAIAEAAKGKSRPCPFCGATPHHGLTKVEHCQLHGDDFQRYEIWCPHGCARINRVNEQQARIAWNTRLAALEAERAVIASTRPDSALLADIAEMMGEFVDNWPEPKRVDTALKLIAKTMRSALDPPKHAYWGAGETDCPPDIKAGNGELHTLRCKVCGNEDARNTRCHAALRQPAPRADDALRVIKLRQALTLARLYVVNVAEAGGKFAAKELALIDAALASEEPTEKGD